MSDLSPSCKVPESDTDCVTIAYLGRNRLAACVTKGSSTLGYGVYRGGKTMSMATSDEGYVIFRT